MIGSPTLGAAIFQVCLHPSEMNSFQHLSEDAVIFLARVFSLRDPGFNVRAYSRWFSDFYGSDHVLEHCIESISPLANLSHELDFDG